MRAIAAVIVFLCGVFLPHPSPAVPVPRSDEELHATAESLRPAADLGGLSDGVRRAAPSRDDRSADRAALREATEAALETTRRLEEIETRLQVQERMILLGLAVLAIWLGFFGFRLWRLQERPLRKGSGRFFVSGAAGNPRR